MIIENTQVQMRKGILEYCILSIISHGESYASDIIEELRNAIDEVVELPFPAAEEGYRSVFVD